MGAGTSLWKEACLLGRGVSLPEEYPCGRGHVLVGRDMSGMSFCEDACHCKNPVLVVEGMSTWAFSPVLVGGGIYLQEVVLWEGTCHFGRGQIPVWGA